MACQQIHEVSVTKKDVVYHCQDNQGWKIPTDHSVYSFTFVEKLLVGPTGLNRKNSNGSKLLKQKKGFVNVIVITYTTELKNILECDYSTPQCVTVSIST